MKSHCPGLLTSFVTGIFKGEKSNLNGDDYNGLDSCIFLRLWYRSKQDIPQNFNAA